MDCGMRAKGVGKETKIWLRRRKKEDVGPPAVAPLGPVRGHARAAAPRLSATVVAAAARLALEQKQQKVNDRIKQKEEEQKLRTMVKEGKIELPNNKIEIPKFYYRGGYLHGYKKNDK